MQKQKLVISITAEDHPGILQLVSDTILEHGGNWLESSLSRLCGQFVGLVSLEVAEADQAGLATALEKLHKQGLQVSAQTVTADTDDSNLGDFLELKVEANDRTGIVEEVAAALADARVNIIQMETACESASMAGYQLFVAHLVVSLPADFDSNDLEEVLEDVSDDLIVSIHESAENY